MQAFIEYVENKFIKKKGQIRTSSKKMSEETSLNDDDPFDILNNMTSDAYKKGYDEGLLSGERAARLQGAKMGIKLSLEMTKELGYYFGICEIYLKLNKTKQDQINTEIRARTIASQLCEHINRINMNDSQYANLFTDLKFVRDKFRQFCSLTNFKSEFKVNIEKTNQPELSF
jgi:hypothetical protein